MGINGSLTHAQILAIRKAQSQGRPYTPMTQAQIRAAKKRMAQGRPGTGRIS
jgi:hypothetical protein